MRSLLAGFESFRRHTFPQKQELYRQLASGQQPSALFITCSDSRIVPNLITGAEPGGIFVLRNAGNLVPRFEDNELGEAATIEYAVKALKIRDIVVCGHAQCGAMKAVIDPQSCAELPTVAAWIAKAQAALERVGKDRDGTPGDKLLELVIQQNVLVQLDNLRTHPAVQAALEEGAVELHGWVYDFAAASVAVYDPRQNQFAPFRPEADAPSPTQFAADTSHVSNPPAS